MGILSTVKGLIGANDIQWDVEGLGANFSKRASKQKVRQDKFVNADDVPVLFTTRLLKYADQTTPFSAGEISVDKLLVKILGNLENIGLPSATFFDINAVGGELTILSNSITATQIALATITAAELANGAVTEAKIGADAVTSAKIGDDQVDSEHIVAGALDHEHYSLNSVGPENLDMDNLGAQPFVYPVWAEINKVVNVTTAFVEIAGISAQKTITGTMGVIANIGSVNTGGLSVENAWVSDTNEVTIAVTGPFNAADTVTYQVFETVTDKT